MSITDTTPPPSPTDKLLGWVIVAVAGIGMAALVGIIYLAAMGSTIPDVLPQLALQAVTGLVALLAGRGRA
jgi:hypothetical protein